MSGATIRSAISHVKLLQANNISISTKSFLAGTNRLLDSLKNRKGETLSLGYKIQLGVTIKRMFPESDVDINVYKEKTNSLKTSRASNVNFMSKVKRLLQEASLYLGTINPSEIINDIGMYDTCTAIVISSCTSLRISEIMQLKMSDATSILRGLPIFIKSKGSGKESRNVAPNDILVRLLKLLARHRPIINGNPESKMHKGAASKQLRLQNGYIIISSESHITKKLKELAAVHELHFDVLGFNIFRKYITTMLVNRGGHLVAQAMNNHTSLNTTFNHYTTLTSDASEKTYDSIFKTSEYVMPPTPYSP